MLKRIPKSDISIRPFKAYKEWSFDETTAASASVYIYSASVGNVVNDFPTASVYDPTNDKWITYYPASIYGNIKSTFYNGQEDNPITRIGLKTNTFTIFTNAKERNLEDFAKVISIPNIYVGEGIKKNSVTINDAGELYIDDGFGNLRGSNVELVLESINFNNSSIQYLNLENGTFTLTLISLNLETNQVIFNYNSINYTQTIIQLDFENSILEVDALPFLDNIIGVQGNVFYNQGIIVLTKNATTKLLSNWDLSFKSTQTIYENEYLLIVNEDEFNVSTNPTSIETIGMIVTSSIELDDKSNPNSKKYIKKIITNPGTQYIKKKTITDIGTIVDYRFSGSVGNTKAGFEHWDISSSVDSTGSFLAPFITTIGLYNDACELLAVAKLPQPIKSEPDIPVNFIVRFDT
jgi:uncharacterized protein (DUF2164 family)